jgi:glycogen debranching enzyme
MSRRLCAGGAPAQAWSVAELIQILSVDLAEKPVMNGRVP